MHKLLITNEQLTPCLPDGVSVKIIGLGGTGSIVARYISIFLASLKKDIRLVLIDGDQFEGANASRMMFSEKGNKAMVIRRELLGVFSDSPFLSISAIPQYLTVENIPKLILNEDVLILCLDNHATRKLVNDFCKECLSDVSLISGGNDGVGKDTSGVATRGTYGNVQLYLKGNNHDLTPCLTKYHPEIMHPRDKNPADKNCTELIESVPQILFANLASASAILNAFWLYCCQALHYSELSFDIADGLMRPMPFSGPDSGMTVLDGSYNE